MRSRLRRAASWLSALFRRWAGEGPVVREYSFGAEVMTAVVRLRLDRLRQFRLTMWEAAEFRRRTGVSLFRDGISILDMDEDHFLELLTVCALRDDPAVTAEVLSPHIVGERITEAVAAIAILLGEFMPPADEGGGSEDPTMASVPNRSTRRATGRSPHRPSGSMEPSTGA